MEDLAIIILAAGKGKRMRSDLPKVLLRAGQKSLITHVLETAQQLSGQRKVIVVGHQHELVRKEAEALGQRGTSFVLQREQLGTGDAVRCALGELEQVRGNIVILYGDVPLIRARTLLDLIAVHRQNGAAVSLISFKPSEPGKYGRVIRGDNTKLVERIVEFNDCNSQEAAVEECNSGIYCVDAQFLRQAVHGLNNNNAQREYYLTDIVAAAVKQGLKVAALCLKNEQEVLGVNTPADLALVNRELLMRKVEELIEKGVEVVDPATLYLDPEVEVEAGAKIGPNVQIVGASRVASGVIIEGSAYIKDSEIKEGALVKFNVRCEGAVIGERAEVGPFANLRPGTVLGERTKVGNFVEIKKASLDRGAKASHLSYLGDCSIGSGTNIGAGTITCNYDGYRKHHTTIGKEVFVGSDTTLVAPIEVGDGAFVGAGSTLRANVPAGALVLTRGQTVLRADWAKTYRQKNKRDI